MNIVNTLRALVAAQVVLVLALVLLVLVLEERSSRRRYTDLVLGTGAGWGLGVAVAALKAPAEFAGLWWDLSNDAVNFGTAIVLLSVAFARSDATRAARPDPSPTSERVAIYWTLAIGALLMLAGGVIESPVTAGLCVAAVIVVWGRALRSISVGSARGQAMWSVRLGYGAVAAGAAAPVCSHLLDAWDLAAIAAAANALAALGSACLFAAAEAADRVTRRHERSRVGLVCAGIVCGLLAMAAGEVLVLLLAADRIGWLAAIAAAAVAHVMAALAVLVVQQRRSQIA